MKRVFACIISIVLLLLASGHATAESSRELIENSVGYDGMTVTYRGEVIGPVMIRGDYAWVNVLDNGIAIGVWCSAADAEKISVTGDYKHVGDTVEIAGTFHRACPEHGGDLDIHATSLTISQNGYSLEKPVSWPLALLSAFLVVVTIFVIRITYQKRKEKIISWPYH